MVDSIYITIIKQVILFCVQETVNSYTSLLHMLQSLQLFPLKALNENICLLHCNFTGSLIKGYPNTYTFAKAIAEEVVRSRAGDMPISIVRPAVGKILFFIYNIQQVATFWWLLI